MFAMLLQTIFPFFYNGIKKIQCMSVYLNNCLITHTFNLDWHKGQDGSFQKVGSMNQLVCIISVDPPKSDLGCVYLD